MTSKQTIYISVQRVSVSNVCPTEANQGGLGPDGIMVPSLDRRAYTDLPFEKLEYAVQSTWGVILALYYTGTCPYPCGLYSVLCTSVPLYSVPPYLRIENGRILPDSLVPWFSSCQPPELSGAGFWCFLG